VGPHICAEECLAGVDGPEPERSSQLPKDTVSFVGLNPDMNYDSLSIIYPFL